MLVMWLVILLFVFVRVCMGVHPILGNCHFIVALLAVFYFSNYCVVCCLLPVFVVCVWTLGSLTYYYLIVFRYATGTDQTDLRTALLCLCRVCGRIERTALPGTSTVELVQQQTATTKQASAIMVIM